MTAWSAVTNDQVPVLFAFFRLVVAQPSWFQLLYFFAERESVTITMNLPDAWCSNLAKTILAGKTAFRAGVKIHRDLSVPRKVRGFKRELATYRECGLEQPVVDRSFLF